MDEFASSVRCKVLEVGSHAGSLRDRAKSGKTRGIACGIAPESLLGNDGRLSNMYQHGLRGAPSARAPRNQTGARPGRFLCRAQAEP